MKILIIGLLTVFLIGSFDGVSHAKSNESKKSEIVKLEAVSIDYAVVSDEVVINAPVVIGSFNYETEEAAKLSLSLNLFYQVFKLDKNGGGKKNKSCIYNLTYSDPASAKPKKTKYNFIRLYHRPKLC